ncbi:desulfoferrodoxin [Methanobrevibacter cuticularis]|uniref:Desulfoferrodoxin n=1 Tax=Methanobrevibacter cuticularis TaxID=47311 RepID=A0A166EDR4_9EURY|nr:desulfoferrodoxin [Methanobrevibacter cuticularis]KZX16542.1 desulfoferrodoxin [Methanobrevibacter cuticularis]
MTELNEIFKCNKCNKVVNVMVDGSGELICDGESMERLEAKTVDEGKEKHVPVIEKNGSTVTVKIGEVPHPMIEEHHICFIELFVGDEIFRKFLNAGDEPKAIFEIGDYAGDLKAREYCNVHGLWTS